MGEAEGRTVVGSAVDCSSSLLDGLEREGSSSSFPFWESDFVLIVNY